MTKTSLIWILKKEILHTNEVNEVIFLVLGQFFKVPNSRRTTNAHDCFLLFETPEFGRQNTIIR